MEILCCSCWNVFKACCGCNIWWPIAVLGIAIALVTCVICCVKYSCYKKELKCFISQKEEKGIEKRLNEINDTLKQIQSKMK